MKKGTRYLLSAVCAVLLLALAAGCTAQAGADRGNTVGNISNHGAAVADNGDVYYASFGIFKAGAADTAVKLSDVSAGYLNIWNERLYFKNYNSGGRIYSCALDGTDMQCVTAEHDASFLNIVEGTLYFYSDAIYDTSGIYSCKPDGSELKKISTDRAGYMAVYDGRIYFSNKVDGFKLYSMNLQAEDRKVLDDEAIRCIDISGGKLYYGKADGIYRKNCDGSATPKKLSDIGTTSLVVCGGKIYHSDNGMATKGVPQRPGVFMTPIAGGDAEQISESSCAGLYCAGDSIYMMAMSGSGLMYRFGAEGKELEMLPVGEAPEDIENG